MAFVFKKINPKRRKLRIAKSERSQQILDALSDYIEGGYEEPMKWLVRTWKEQENTFLYPDLYSIVTDETFPQAVFDDWFKSYSTWVSERMTDTWKDAMENGWKNNPVFQGMQDFTFNSSESRVRSWILNHGAELVTNCVTEQKNAIQYLVAEAQASGISSAELGRYIRPTIGLTRQQAAANLRHYESVKSRLRQDHPRMSEASIEQKAREAAAKYAAKQQRYRAETIARTEMAYAYNKGNDEAVRQAMEQRKLPIMRKVWTTAQDGHVCPECEDLEDTEIGMNEEFKVMTGIRVKREITCSEPPLHPRCKCAIAYEETGEYVTDIVANPEEDATMITETDTDTDADTVSAESTSIASAVDLPNAEERARVINEAITAPIPVYASDLRAAYKNVKPMGDCYDVCMHGTPDHTEYEKKYKIDTETLYLIITGRRDYHWEDIRLLACSTGNADENGNCVAQELASRLGVRVFAPIAELNIHGNGDLSVGADYLSVEKGFRWFDP